MMVFKVSVKKEYIQLMAIKLTLIATLSIALYGCSSFDYLVDKGQHMSHEAGKSLGLVKEKKMTVPAYYSTEGLPKKTQAGQVIKLPE